MTDTRKNGRGADGLVSLQQAQGNGTHAGRLSGYAAVIFDMDGVVTDTAGVHAAAWKALFDPVLAQTGTGVQPPFDVERDYRAFVDGRPREDGVRTFLASRGITLPEGSRDDGPESPTVNGLAVRKQQFFTAELQRSGVAVFPDAVDLLRELAARQVRTALVTSSRNSAAILDAAGGADLFSVRVDGTDADRLGLPGKPDPAMFLEAARLLGVPPAEAIVIEDATSGVRAAVDGRFGLVVGVARAGTEADLAAAGAHVVVRELGALLAERAPARPADDALPHWCGGASPLPEENWNLVYDAFDPLQEGTREALCTLGNGYWATRGAVPGTTADGVHYPGTYLAGAYNRLTTALDGREMETEHLVNAPDWGFVTVRAATGPVLRPGSPEMLSHHQDLDLRRGVLTRTNRYRDAAGRTTRITSRQFQSMDAPHLAAMEVTAEAEDWSGELTVESAVNGDVSNRNVASDRALVGQHLSQVRAAALDHETVVHEAITGQSGITISTAARTRVSPHRAEVGRRYIAAGSRTGHELTLSVSPGHPVTIEKTVAVATSRDRAASTATLDATHRIRRAEGFSVMLSSHAAAWDELWQTFGIQLAADARQSLAMNLHVFHVLQSVVSASPDLDAGLPARGLHGEGYRGHIFWDELFVYPVLTLRRPELTRAYLLYRYRRLDAARAAARGAGLHGAMFPWQSGSDGREETPAELLNVRNGTWMPDNSHRQRHVGLAVAYSVWQYYQATADTGFLTEYGAEMLIEVARLFASMAVHDTSDDRFDISGVMGPDEYHDGYPDAPGQGVRNNAYTNVLAAWVLARACEAMELLAGTDGDRLRHRLALLPEEPANWDRISRRLRVPFHEDVISQFEGYERLEELDWDDYRRRYGNIGRLDLILQAEGDATNRYKLSKQADVLTLFYLFSAEELRDILARLGYALTPETISATVRYYLARTSHGSTLSRLVHGWVLARTDRANSWALFKEALEADLADTQGGTTREGVHVGAMAGTADMVLRCYGGLETRSDMLWLHPVLPAGLRRASFRLDYRGQPVTVTVTPDTAEVRLHDRARTPIRVCVEGTERDLHPGQVWNVRLSPGTAHAPGHPLPALAQHPQLRTHRPQDPQHIHERE